MMDKFISEHLYAKEIEVYFGGNGSQRLRGKVVGWSWRTREGETT
jgi:hypothetical protein